MTDAKHQKLFPEPEKPPKPRRLPRCACCGEGFYGHELRWRGDRRYCVECLERIETLARKEHDL